MKALDEFLDVAAVGVGHDSFHVHVGIDLAKLPFRRHRLGQALSCVGLVKKHLALEVRFLHEIAIHDAHSPHARAHQGIGLRRPERAAAENHHFRLQQLLLPLRANGRKENLPRILLRVHEGPIHGEKAGTSRLPMEEVFAPRLNNYTLPAEKEDEPKTPRVETALAGGSSWN